MKLFKILSVGALVILLSMVTANAQGIVGSAHDFSSAAWNPSGEICVVCHTPHNGNTNVTDAPLWNHEVTTAQFVPYSSSTLDASVGQPDGVSKLCLSCHDGTVALDNFGGKTDGTTYISQNDGAYIGTDLSDDHPVSFVYDAALASADGGLFDPTTTNSGLGSTIDADMLYSHKLECASCHDVHNGSGEESLLIKSNAASALCLTCHDK